MSIHGDGRNHRGDISGWQRHWIGRCTGRETWKFEPFFVAPSVISAGDDDIDFLDAVTADIAAKQAVRATGTFVEGKPPRVAHPIGVDFFFQIRGCVVEEGVAGRDAVLTSGTVVAQRINPQDFPEVPSLVLGVAKIVGWARPAATGMTDEVVLLTPSVPGGDVKVPFATGTDLRPELKLTTFVIGLRL